MAGTVDWWNAHDSWVMLRLAFDGLCLITAWVSAERCRMWSKRSKARDLTIRRLRAVDANRRAAARALPAAPKRIPAAPRTRFRWIWPGDNAGLLPIPPYGTEQEHLETDPRIPPKRRPTPTWLREWLATPEMARYPMTVEQAAALYEPTRVWVVPNLPDAVPHLQEVR